MGFKASDFRRAFLVTADLRQLLDAAQADTLTLTVADVSQARLDGRNRLILQWQEDVLALPLNATNLDAMSSSFGDDTDGWHGARLQLWLEATEMNGVATDGIRLRRAAETAPTTKADKTPQRKWGVPPAPPRPQRAEDDEY